MTSAFAKPREIWTVQHPVGAAGLRVLVLNDPDLPDETIGVVPVGRLEQGSGEYDLLLAPEDIDGPGPRADGGAVRVQMPCVLTIPDAWLGGIRDGWLTPSGEDVLERYLASDELPAGYDTAGLPPVTEAEPRFDVLADAAIEWLLSDSSPAAVVEREPSVAAEASDARAGILLGMRWVAIAGGDEPLEAEPSEFEFTVGGGGIEGGSEVESQPWLLIASVSGQPDTPTSVVAELIPPGPPEVEVSYALADAEGRIYEFSRSDDRFVLEMPPGLLGKAVHRGDGTVERLLNVELLSRVADAE